MQAGVRRTHRLAADPVGPDTFGRLWRRIIEQTLESRAFVEMVVEARRQLRDAKLTYHLPQMLREPLERAQSAGLIPQELSVQDVVLAHRMAYGVIVTETDPTLARDSVLRALAMVDPTLSWSEDERDTP